MSEKDKYKATGSSGKPGDGGNGGSGYGPLDPSEMQNMMNTFMAMLRAGNGQLNQFDEEQEAELRGKLNQRLLDKPPVTVAFPPCTDVLLSLIRSDKPEDEINRNFTDYFRFCDHTVLADRSLIDPSLLNCEDKWVQNIPSSACDSSIFLENPNTELSASTALHSLGPAGWPPPWCLPRSCTTLSGDRHLYKDADPAPNGRLRRLFLADTGWLYFMERMGVLQILARILDEYAYGGKIPISNGVAIPGPLDDMVALVLEAMTRQMEAGTASSRRARVSTFERTLGWDVEAGQKLELKSVVNNGFQKGFDNFISTTEDYYNHKRLASLIKDTASSARPSASTLVAISDSLNLLRKTFDNFDYGRNYYNTLNGIVWVVAAMSVIRDMRGTLGIPPEFEQPYEFIPAAYDLLVLNRPITPSEANRYQLHRDCANAARDILLDIEVLNFQDARVGGELDVWLNTIEDKVETYRTTYRAITGVDLFRAHSHQAERAETR